jgi:hypothetical protein
MAAMTKRRHVEVSVALAATALVAVGAVAGFGAARAMKVSDTAATDPAAAAVGASVRTVVRSTDGAASLVLFRAAERPESASTDEAASLVLFRVAERASMGR